MDYRTIGLSKMTFQRFWDKFATKRQQSNAQSQEATSHISGLKFCIKYYLTCASPTSSLPTNALFPIAFWLFLLPPWRPLHWLFNIILQLFHSSPSKCLQLKLKLKKKENHLFIVLFVLFLYTTVKMHPVCQVTTLTTIATTFKLCKKKQKTKQQQIEISVKL